MHIGWPQGILLTLMIMSLGISIAKYGEPQKGTYDSANILAPFILIALLWWGGFFN